MKTTIELPDELMRSVKIRAVNEGRRLKDVMADVIRRGLAQAPADSATPPRPQRQVTLPLVRCAHPASARDEVTPGKVAEILAQEEANGLAGHAS